MKENEGKLHSGGNTIGYKPQYKDRETGKWLTVETQHQVMLTGRKVEGIPYPTLFAGILDHLWLYGKSQALAFAYSYAANYEALHHWPLEVRVVPYKITFNIDYEETIEPND